MSKDNKKLETDLFKSKDEQNSVERIVNNFLKLLKYDYLVLSAFYFARAKFPNNTNIHTANNYFLFYDYVGQIFKNAAREVDTTFSFSYASSNYFVLNLRQVYKDIVGGSTSFNVEHFTSELNDYLNRLSGLIARSSIIFKNWSAPHIGLDTALINKKIKEREEILNTANKKFSGDLNTIAGLAYLDDLNLVFSKFANGKIGVSVKSDNVLEVAENLKLTNNMISVFEAFFLFKSNSFEKINSSYISQSTTLHFILRQFLRYVTESPYNIPDKYKALKENCFSRTNIKNKSIYLEAATPNFKNLLFLNLTYHPSRKLVPSLESGLIDFGITPRSEYTILESIRSIDGNPNLSETSHTNFISITWNKDYLSEKGIQSALFLTDLSVNKEAITALLKHKEDLKNKLQAFVVNRKKDLISLLELQTVQNLVSKKIESVSAFCKKQLELLDNKIKKEESSKFDSIAAIENRPDFKKDYDAIRSLLYEGSDIVAETPTKNKIHLRTADAQSASSLLTFPESKEDNNLYFDLNKVLKDLFFLEQNYTEHTVSVLMQKYWALSKIFRIFSVSSGFVYNKIKDMELDRHQFTKSKTEDNLASVIASLMQKLYDKSVSATEFNSLLASVYTLVRKSGLDTGETQPPEPASPPYYNWVGMPETGYSAQGTQITLEPDTDGEPSETERDNGPSDGAISRIIHEGVMRTTSRSQDIPVHTLASVDVAQYFADAAQIFNSRGRIDSE